MVKVITSPVEMAEMSKGFLGQKLTIGFVPTMGALHKGHLSLVERARGENDITAVSIFVNPVQFGPEEDFRSYPRDMEGDIVKLDKLNVDIVFTPSEDDLYPVDYYTYVTVEGLTEKLCGAFRPGHFRGVSTIVAKLFNVVQPTRAYFGQKDYQQSLVLRTMVKDLNMSVDVITCPIIREEDGLAMSSRNAYLNEEERRAARVIYRSLLDISNRLTDKRLSLKDVGGELKRLLSGEDLVSEIQYASAYDPYSLEEIKDDEKRDAVLLAAALYIGRTRLIDNLVVKT